MPASSDLSPQDPIVARLRAGDAEAFAVLHAECYAQLWRFAYGYTHVRQDASEIVQDAFARVWEGRERLDPSGSILAYLYRLIRNAAIDRRRHERVVCDAEMAYASESTVPGMGEPVPTPDAQVELAETKAVLARALAALPERRRAALLLRWQHDMPYDEIALVLGVTPAAARQLVTRAREAVRAALAALG